MKLEIKDKGFEYEHSYDTATDVIYRLIHIYASLISNRKKWLSQRETEFYTAILLCHYLNLRFDKSESDFVFDSIFKLTINRRKDYLDKIIERGWVKVGEDDSLIFPEIFRSFNINDNSYNIEINLLWD